MTGQETKAQKLERARKMEERTRGRDPWGRKETMFMSESLLIYNSQHNAMHIYLDSSDQLTVLFVYTIDNN
jgi:hypothetical protein